ncbi:MAG: DUF1573 domain-containing protein [Planctomycetota bacterium]|nr:DUF1573 domain-containing protein [Planctomycetales bacterium]RLS43894.1 MAG: DUF1573 domain-containing protein [Planctomycetota bacterium]
MTILAPLPALFTLIVAAATIAPVPAQDWGDRMLDRTEVKFGSVARLADTTFKIKVTNRYQDPIQVTSLGVSCGCISWVDTAPFTLASKEVREITLRLDTVRFTGDRNVRATISLYEPAHGYTDSVTIPVSAHIRTDVEASPSHVGFGTIDLGKGYTQRIGINYVGGRGDWKIKSAKASSPHLTTEVVELRRSGGTANYEVRVAIDGNAPTGLLRDQLVLTTDEVGNNNVISIPIEAKIEADIVVTDVQFGTVSPGQAKSMNVIVRGKKPFKIAEVNHVTREVRLKPADDVVSSGVIPPVGTQKDAASVPATASLSDDAFKIKCPEAAAVVHMVPLTLTPPAESGLFDEEFVLKIDGRAQPVTFKAKGRISVNP